MYRETGQSHEGSLGLSSPPDLPGDYREAQERKQRMTEGLKKFRKEREDEGGRITVPRSHTVDSPRRVTLEDINPIRAMRASRKPLIGPPEEKFEVTSVDLEIDKREIRINRILGRLDSLDKPKTIRELAARRKLQNSLRGSLEKLAETRNLQSLIRKDAKSSDNEKVEKKILDNLDDFDAEFSKLLASIHEFLPDIRP